MKPGKEQGKGNEGFQWGRMKKKEEPAWESLIGAKIEAHRGTYKPQRIEDSRKRNAARATKRWRQNNMERYKETKRKWEKEHPEKMKMYSRRHRGLRKKWAEENHERVLELNRKSDRKRRKTEKRKEWEKEYRNRPEVKARRKEYDKKRNRSPERKAYERERSRKRREENNMKKEAT